MIFIGIKIPLLLLALLLPKHPIALPEIVTSTQDQVGLLVERAAHLAQSAVAGAALETVLVPELVDRLQQESVCDGGATAGTEIGRWRFPRADPASSDLRLLPICNRWGVTSKRTPTARPAPGHIVHELQALSMSRRVHVASLDAGVVSALLSPFYHSNV